MLKRLSPCIYVRVLLLADILVRFAFFVMQNYLTNVWGLSFAHAAGILNIWNGISMILPGFLLFLVDAVIGNFTMLVISSIAYTLGIGLVAMSTPPGLANWTGTCTQYEAECIGHTQKALFYTGMALLAVGTAGYNVSLHPFIEENEYINKPDDVIDDESAPQDRLHFQDILQLVLVPVIGAIVLPFIKSWSLAFGIPAISSAIATSIFLTGWSKYRKVERQGSQLSFIAEAAKITVRMVPMWLTFIVCGIVSSIGNTYFIEQASRMDRKIGLGAWEVPIEIILLLGGWTKDGAILLAGKFPKSLERPNTFAIAISMVYSVLCCITAAKIETKRIKVITRYGLLDKPDEEIPMRVSWLYFQFFLLTAMELGMERSVGSIYKNECSVSMKKYVDYFSKGVFGVGFMCSVLSVYAVGKVSERGGKRNWFQFTLNRSRLDRYYWVLAGLTSANLVLFILIAPHYRYKKVVEEEEKAAAVEEEVVVDGTRRSPADSPLK